MEKCKELQKLPHNKLIEWESETASKFSPGPVNNKEVLCRQIDQPLHYNKDDNAFTAQAFDDVFDKGLSVNRRNYTTYGEISRNAESRIQQRKLNSNTPGNRSFVGIIEFNCEDIRKITVRSDEVNMAIRGFAVYDTAYVNDKSHADICLIVENKNKVRRSLRVEIMDLANNFLKNNSFRNIHTSNSSKTWYCKILSVFKCWPRFGSNQ